MSGSTYHRGKDIRTTDFGFNQPNCAVVFILGKVRIFANGFFRDFDETRFHVKRITPFYRRSSLTARRLSKQAQQVLPAESSKI